MNSPMVLSFDDWLKDNQDVSDQEFSNLDHKIECDECNGTGYIDLDDKDDYRFRIHMRTIYEHRKREDLKRLEKWNAIVQESKR